jgi:hypothetical protein
MMRLGGRPARHVAMVRSSVRRRHGCQYPLRSMTTWPRRRMRGARTGSRVGAVSTDGRDMARRSGARVDVARMTGDTAVARIVVSTHRADRAHAGRRSPAWSPLLSAGEPGVGTSRAPECRGVVCPSVGAAIVAAHRHVRNPRAAAAGRPGGKRPLRGPGRAALYGGQEIAARPAMTVSIARAASRTATANRSRMLATSMRSGFWRAISRPRAGTPAGGSPPDRAGWTQSGGGSRRMGTTDRLLAGPAASHGEDSPCLRRRCGRDGERRRS